MRLIGTLLLSTPGRAYEVWSDGREDPENPDSVVLERMHEQLAAVEILAFPPRYEVVPVGLRPIRLGLTPVAAAADDFFSQAGPHAPTA
jgi:hypothetical protein